MATAHPLPGPADEPLRGTASSAGAERPDAVQALVPAPHPPEAETEIAFSAPVLQLPVELDVAIPVREFRVRHLLALAPGQLIQSRWNLGNDLPLAAGEVQLAWSEFEVVETQLAVRVTRLA